MATVGGRGAVGVRVRGPAVGRALLVVILSLVLPAPMVAVQAPDAPDPQVRAILFYSPGCPHCHDVMQDHLPPLLERYGGALRIVAVNVDTGQGQALYQAVALHFRLPRQRLGVPALVVGEEILVGAWEIPSRLPRLVEAGLAGAGVDWPPIPAVRSFLTLQGLAAGASVELEPWMLSGAGGAGGVGAGQEVVRVLGSEPGSEASSMAARFAADPVGNGTAVVVLLGMVAVVVVCLREVVRANARLREWPSWVVPALAAAGTTIALYMAYVEVTGTPAVCGPVGDCNRVQLSPFASVAGIPVGVIGVVGYVVLTVLWTTAERRGTDRRRIVLAVWGLALAGVGFSIYLTFLEPFVIGATCVWCLNSAVIMTLILMAATPAAARVRRPGRSRQDLQPHHIDALAGHLAYAQSDVAEVHRAVDGDLVGR